jgi:hypothetical protein
MAARSGVIFPASMANVLAKPVEICFRSFTATSTTLAVRPHQRPSIDAPATLDAAPSSSKKSKTHQPKPYDIIQGMEHVIDMIEETLHICERDQRSTQDASHFRTFPFGLRPSSDVYAR